MTPKQMMRALAECLRYLTLHRRSSLLDYRTRPHGEGRPSGLIVTLSTLPSRIGKIGPALNSLLDQTVRPESIFLALPAKSIRERKEYIVPPWLLDHPVVTILPTEKDWGPATKLIPVLRHFAHAPETTILAVDDDNVYPRQYIETFVRFAHALPEAALSLRGWPISPSRKWRDSREFKGTQINSPVETDIITGCGGIMVRPRFFDADFFDYGAAPPQAFFVDDIWISGHLARRKIAKYVLPFSGAFVYLPAWSTRKGPALDRDENRSGQNNDAMIDYFGKFWIDQKKR